MYATALEFCVGLIVFGVIGILTDKNNEKR